MIINQIASGGGGGDTSDATAYPQHILKDYTAYARGSKIVGTYEPISAIPAILGAEALNQQSGTLVISTTCTAKVGTLLIVACHLRGDFISITEGWVKLAESPPIIMPTYTQKAYIFAKIAESTSEFVEIERATSPNTASYLSWINLDTDIIPLPEPALIKLSEERNFLSYVKPSLRPYIIVVTSVYWSDTASVRWTLSPLLSTYKNFQADASPRLLLVFDDDTSIEQRIFGTTLTGATDGYLLAMCGVYL